MRGSFGCKDKSAAWRCFAFRGKTLEKVGENQCLERETWALPRFRDFLGEKVGASPFLFIQSLPQSSLWGSWEPGKVDQRGKEMQSKGWK